MGAAKNCTIPNNATVRPAKKYQYFCAMSAKRNEGDVGSVKIIGTIGIIIPIPIMSSTRVKKSIVNVFRAIYKVV